MKSIYNQFLDFKKRHNLSNELISKIAKEYADSDLELARTYFSEKYGISQHVFYKARDFAIVFCLVDKKTFYQIRQKSITNYKNNNEKSSAAKSIAHFDNLILQQQKFLDDFSNNDILDIALKYIEGVSTKNIAIAYDTGEYAIKKLLKKGITDLILDVNIVNQIKSIVGYNLSTILAMRNANKILLIDCIEKKISFLQSEIKCYDLCFRNSTTRPSIESLEIDLQNAIKMYNEALKL